MTRQEIVLEFAKAIIIANPKDLHGNWDLVVPKNVIEEAHKFADELLKPYP